MTSTDEPIVRYTASDGIATIILNRPRWLNAVTPELVDALVIALDQARADGVAAAVLAGEGRAFCAGHDLKHESGPISEDEDRRRIHRIQDVTRKVRQSPFGVIAAVQGYALGAGCEFALTCDFIMAAEDATFGFPEVGVGLGVTGGMTHLLPQAIGPVRAKRLVMLGEQFSAPEALAMGLITEVVAPGEHMKRAMEIAATLASRPQRATALAKFAIDLGHEVPIEASYEIEIAHALALHNTADAAAAATAFRSRD